MLPPLDSVWTFLTRISNLITPSSCWLWCHVETCSLFCNYEFGLDNSTRIYICRKQLISPGSSTTGYRPYSIACHLFTLCSPRRVLRYRLWRSTSQSDPFVPHLNLEGRPYTENECTELTYTKTGFHGHKALSRTHRSFHVHTGVFTISTFFHVHQGFFTFMCTHFSVHILVFTSISCFHAHTVFSCKHHHFRAHLAKRTLDTFFVSKWLPRKTWPDDQNRWRSQISSPGIPLGSFTTSSFY